MSLEYLKISKSKYLTFSCLPYLIATGEMLYNYYFERVQFNSKCYLIWRKKPIEYTDLLFIQQYTILSILQVMWKYWEKKMNCEKWMDLLKLLLPNNKSTAPAQELRTWLCHRLYRWGLYQTQFPERAVRNQPLTNLGLRTVQSVLLSLQEKLHSPSIFIRRKRSNQRVWLSYTKSSWTLLYSLKEVNFFLQLFWWNYSHFR